MNSNTLHKYRKRVLDYLKDFKQVDETQIVTHRSWGDVKANYCLDKDANKEFLKIYTKAIEKGVNNLTIDDYNDLMMNIDFVSSIPTETFLIFQTDTMICESHKDLIYNFMKYDYVGAPWRLDNTNINGDRNNMFLKSCAKYLWHYAENADLSFHHYKHDAFGVKWHKHVHSSRKFLE
jgi:hypothetical protein